MSLGLPRKSGRSDCFFVEMETADQQRLRAVYCWVNDFFSGQVGIPPVNGYTQLWKEHIGSLAYLCSSKVLRKHTAETPLQAFKDAKATLKALNDKVLFNDRYKELDPEGAAGGNETAIYKFIVLMLSVVSIFLEECLTEAHSVLQDKGLEAVMAGILSQVNNRGQQWWQGSSDIASPAPSTAAENESFGKYEMLPSTPRSILRRNTLAAPVSPIHNAVNSPVTIKARQEELRRMRNRVNELEDTCDQQARLLDQTRQQETQLKLSLAEMKGRWATAEEASKRHQASYDEVVAELEREKALRVDLARKATEIQTSKDKYKAEVERSETQKATLAEQLSSSQTGRAEVEKKLRDIQHEHVEMEERFAAMEKALYEVKAQLEQKTVSEAEAVKACAERAAQHRRDLAKKEEEYQIAITAETDIRLRLQTSHLELQQTTTEVEEKLKQKIEELEEDVDRLKQTIQELEKSKVLMNNEAMKTEQKYEEKMEAMRTEASASKDIDQQNIAILGEKLARLTTKLEETEERLQEQTARALANGELHVAALADTEALNRTVAQLQEELKNALADEEKIQQLRLMEEELRAARASLEAMEATELELRADLLEQADQLEKTQTEAGAHLEGMEEQLRVCQRELKNTQHLNQNLESEREVLLEKEARLGVVERELRNMTAERETLLEKEARLTNVEKDVLAKSDRIQCLEKDLREMKTERDDLSEELAQLEVKQRVLTGKSSMLQAVEDDRNTLYEKLQQLQTRHADELMQANSTNHQLTMKIEEVLRDSAKKEQSLAELNQRMSQMEGVAQQIVANNFKLSNENDALNQQKSLLEQQLAEASERLEQELEPKPQNLEESIGQLETTIVHELSNATREDSTIGDLNHLDMMEDDDDEVVFYSKNIDGTTYEQSYRLPAASTSQGPNFDVDRERIEELKRRNETLPMALRCSYATEMTTYASPSANERQMQAGLQTPQAPRVQDAPETPIADDKENAPAEKPSTKSNRFTRRISNVFGKQKNK